MDASGSLPAGHRRGLRRGLCHSGTGYQALSGYGTGPHRQRHPSGGSRPPGCGLEAGPHCCHPGGWGKGRRDRPLLRHRGLLRLRAGAAPGAPRSLRRRRGDDRPVLRCDQLPPHCPDPRVRSLLLLQSRWVPGRSRRQFSGVGYGGLYSKQKFAFQAGRSHGDLHEEERYFDPKQ